MMPIRRASPATWAMLTATPLLCGAGVILLVFAPQLSPVIRYAAVCVLAYLVGALSWGYMLVDLVMGEDIRHFGSGRTGMSNILRTAGGRAAALVFVLDAGKAVLIVLMARTVTGSVEVEVAAALAALCGHNWPVYLGFRGGRGIMPGFGGLSVMAPWVAVAGGALFLGFVAIVPYLASLVTNVQAIQLSSTSLLIMVGVGLDTLRQLEAQLLMRNYEGFLR